MSKLKEFGLGKENVERIDRLVKTTFRSLSSIACEIAEKQTLSIHELRIILAELTMAYTAALNMMTIELANEAERRLAKK